MLPPEVVPHDGRQPRRSALRGRRLPRVPPHAPLRRRGCVGRDAAGGGGRDESAARRWRRRAIRARAVRLVRRPAAAQRPATQGGRLAVDELRRPWQGAPLALAPLAAAGRAALRRRQARVPRHVPAEAPRALRRSTADAGHGPSSRAQGAGVALDAGQRRSAHAELGRPARRGGRARGAAGLAAAARRRARPQRRVAA